MPQRSFRKYAVLLGLAIAVLGAGAVVYKKWARIVNLFDREREDGAAVAALKEAPLPVVAAAEASAGWPQWRGPNRDGVAPAGPFNSDWKASPPRTVWSVPSGGGYASMAVVGGRIYAHDFHDGKERLRCLDAADGKTLWEFAEPADYSSMSAGYATGPRATPTVHGGKVYAVGATGRFVCLEPPPAGGAEPKLLWSHDLLAEFDATIPVWGVASSPLIDGDLVIVQPGGKKGSVAAFDKTTGDLRWAAGKDPNGYSSPVAVSPAGVKQVVAVTGKSVTGIRPTDGSVLWTYPWVTDNLGNIATPVVVGDYVFVSSSYGKGCALLRVESSGGGAKATEVYFRKNRVMKNHQNTCVFRDGYLYGFDGDYLKCVNLRTGQVVQEWEADSGINKGSLILIDKYLLIQTETGKLFLVDADPKEFKLRGKMESVFAGNQNWALPVYVDGRLYLRNHENVKCIEVK